MNGKRFVIVFCSVLLSLATISQVLYTLSLIPGRDIKREYVGTGNTKPHPAIEPFPTLAPPVTITPDPAPIVPAGNSSPAFLRRWDAWAQLTLGYSLYTLEVFAVPVFALLDGAIAFYWIRRWQDARDRRSEQTEPTS